MVREGDRKDWEFEVLFVLMLYCWRDRNMKKLICYGVLEGRSFVDGVWLNLK